MDVSTSSNGRLHQINVSPGGVPKLPVPSAVVESLGIVGDGHTYSGHGGPERALCLYSLERIESLRAEGHDIAPGSTGENLTVAGVDWDRVGPGVTLRIGSTLVAQVSEYTSPCRKIAGSFARGEFERIEQAAHPGWARVYARIIKPGEIKAGDQVVVQQ